MLKIFILFAFLISCMHAQPNINQSRRLLSQLRGGDYAHAGDKEASQLIINELLKLVEKPDQITCLDLGCGLGGTAEDLRLAGFSKINGIDLDADAIKYAQSKDPSVLFYHENAGELSKHWSQDFFGCITLFNVLYAIEDKKNLLKEINQVSHQGAILTIFDYTTSKANFDLKDLSNKPMYPVKKDKLMNELKTSGWEVIKEVNITKQYKSWYKTLLCKLDASYIELKKDFPEEDILNVKTKFTTILDLLKADEMGGSYIIAKKL
jgi:2-polyprenyl-3-methyl-5-hydroxy-6-metoxy-1,4-benzoquinol methylase